MKRIFRSAAIAAVAAIGIGGAYAATSTENDALPVLAARIGLAQAVSTAEQHVGGKAARAEYERHAGQWVFDVEVVKDKKVMDVKVDPTNGQVIAATEDQTDHDDAGDTED